MSDLAGRGKIGRQENANIRSLTSIGNRLRHPHHHPIPHKSFNIYNHQTLHTQNNTKLYIFFRYSFHDSSWRYFSWHQIWSYFLHSTLPLHFERLFSFPFRILIVKTKLYQKLRTFLKVRTFFHFQREKYFTISQYLSVFRGDFQWSFHHGAQLAAAQDISNYHTMSGLTCLRHPKGKF